MQDRGPTKELDLGSSSEDESDAPPPKSGDNSDDESDDEADGGGGRITSKNFEARSRALDAQAAKDAELDQQEFQQNALPGDAEDELVMFELPSPEEREEEKKRGGPDVQEAQRRIKECTRVLADFKRFGAKGR